MKKRQIHGLRSHKLYDVWNAMRERCNNINHKEYSRYGGRGISVCSEWINDFKKYYDWAIASGYEAGLTVDRIDNDGNYEPYNCRITSNYIQTINQRLRRDNKSGYKGIDFLSSKNKWRARIKANGVEYSLGNYSDIICAINARNSFILENNLPHKLQCYKEA